MGLKIFRGLLGVFVAVVALLAWRYWQIDGFWAIIFALGGVSFAYDSPR